MYSTRSSRVSFSHTLPLSRSLSVSLSRTSKCPRTRERREIVSSRAAIDVDDEDEDGDVRST